MSSHFMPAVVVKETGGKGDWNTINLDQVGIPVLNHEEVLVQVEACSVNRADLLQRRGLYPPPPGASTILGLDFAGTVANSNQSPGWKEGDRVFGIVAGGGYGRFVAVPGSHLVRIPDNLNFIEAAAAAEVFFTAYLNLWLEAKMRAGETVLIHGGGSGVGTAAIQLARESGIQVIITAGSEEKLQKALSLGATHGINYRETDFADRVMDLTNGSGVDVVVDWIGAPYLERHTRILKEKGRLIIIGLMGGHKAEIQLGTFLAKRLRMIGSLLRTRSKEEKAALSSAFTRDVLPLLASGRVRPVVDRTYSVNTAEDAHVYMREGNHFGKIVLVWEGF
jgi:putative PIG3 family NAD(P)H quinone oxidoreductase